MIRLRTIYRLEPAFAYVALIIFSGAFIFVLRQSGADGSVTDGDPFARLLYMAIYALTFGLLLLRWREFVWIAVQDKWLVLLILLVFASVLWSDVPALTFRRIVALVGTTVFGIYFAMRFSVRQQVMILAFVLLTIVAFSLLFAAVLPSYGIMSGRHGGSWQGVFTHKNLLGRAAVLTLLVSFFIWFMKPRWRLYALAVSLAALVLLVFADSAGALVVFAGLLIVLPFLPTLRWPSDLAGMLYFGGMFLLGVTAVLVLTNLGEVLALIGRNATLTGRTNLWPLVIDMIQKRPWLGYGFSGFWLGEEGPSYFIWIYTNWVEVPPHAHNGLLDIALDLGLVGLGIYLMGFFLAVGRAIKLASRRGSFEKYWPLMFLIFVFLANQSESAILRTNNLYWLLYVSVVVTLAAKRYAVEQQPTAEVSATKPSYA